MSLFLSAILGGPEQIDKSFMRKTGDICRKIDIHQKEIISSQDGTINVVFQYPGSLLQPDFVGVRTGSFSKKKRILVVQVAVPKEMLSSANFVKHYLEFLKDALAEGKKYLDKKGIPFSLEDHIALANKSVEGLTEET
jgi:hypothetical protein